MSHHVWWVIGKFYSHALPLDSINIFLSGNPVLCDLNVGECSLAATVCLVTGFKKKEFRGKLAIAITANFINHSTKEEAIVEEISGISYIFNQKFVAQMIL